MAIEVIILILVAINVSLLLVVFRDTGKFPEALNRLMKIEHTIQHMAVNLQINQLENTFNNALKEQQEAFSRALDSAGSKVFKSRDGRFTASSIEELFQKMATDPQSTINPHDIESLKNFFEQILTEDTDDFDEEDEDFS